MPNPDDFKRDAKQAFEDLKQSMQSDMRQASDYAQGVVKSENGTNAIVAVIVTVLFGPIGAFFCWLFFANFGFFKSLLSALLFMVLFFIAGLMCIILIGYILVPVVWIYLVFTVYRDVLNAKPEY